MDLSGQSIGDHTLLSELGRGGMGVVYLARHRTADRLAAVKVLHPRLLDDGQMVERFFNEARAAARVEHPGTVEVYDFGRQDGAGAYLVMEYLEGETLGARLRRRSGVPAAEACRIVRAIAGVLDAAHEAGIVHRDLKPDNVFLPEGESGPRVKSFPTNSGPSRRAEAPRCQGASQVPVLASTGLAAQRRQRGWIGDAGDAERICREALKVVDFGIAKLDGMGGSTLRTRTGELLGTPLYMSPEQCHGARAVDHRADVYALGVIAYELVCGRPPFDAEGVGELIAQHLAQAPPAARSLRPDLPPAVEAVLGRALAKDPDARQQTAGALAEELAEAFAAAPLAARPGSPAVGESEAAPPAARRVGHLVLVAALLAALGGGGTLAWLGLTRQRQCAEGDLEGCQAQCERGHEGSCLSLARVYRAGPEDVRAPERAGALLKQLCDGGVAVACRTLGEMHTEGEGVRRDLAQAALLLRAACDGGDVASCASSGRMYSDGEGVARDDAVAAELLRVACEARQPGACTLLGELLQRAGPLRDVERAAGLLAAGCGRQEVDACRAAATLAEGRGDREAARGFDVRACGLGDRPSCEAGRRTEAEPAGPSVRAPEVVDGWVYLGDHRDGGWRTRYFSFSPEASPQSLVGEVVRPLGSSYVRLSEPDDMGRFGRILGVVRPTSRVRLLEVRGWLRTSFIWARVRSAP